MRSWLMVAATTAWLTSMTADVPACDTWLAMWDATKCGHTILGKNSDRPGFDCQPLLFHPRKKWPAGSKINLGRITIPQVEETYANMGSSPYWCWGYEEGINEHGVAIGNEGIHTRVLVEESATHKAGKGPPLGPTGMDLLRLGLERAKTAREAVGVITGLVEQYGQFGAGVPRGGAYHNSYIIADSNEAWILETAGTHWVAKRVTQGIESISNAVSLHSDYDLACDDLVEYATVRGWWPKDSDDKLDFRAAYTNSKRRGAHGREFRTWSLLEEKVGQVDVRWMMRIARDPQGIDQRGTASSCVAVLPKSKDELPVFWWCASVPSRSCYIPFFVHGTGLPQIVSTAGTHGRKIVPPSKAERDSYSDQSYWWLFRDLYEKAREDDGRTRMVRETFDALEKDFEAGVPNVIRKAVQLRDSGKTIEAAHVLDDYSAACVNKVLAKLHRLREQFHATRSVVIGADD